MRKFASRMALLAVCLCVLAQSVSAAGLLVPGGQVIGLALADNTVTVAAFDEQLGQAAREAGLQVGDRIVSIDKQAVHSAEDIQQALARSDGTVDVGVLREGRAKRLLLEPSITVDGPGWGCI